jgi:hypothetical protein
MYLNNKGRGKGRILTPEARAWKTQCGWIIKSLRLPQFKDRVIVKIELDDCRQGDADSRCKAVLDVLKTAGVLVDDRKKYVKGTYIGWADVEGCTVTIERCN